MDTDCSVFFNNFDYLLATRPARIGEIEAYLSNATGSSKAGYFSRLRPTDEKAGKLPSLEVLLLLSEYFAVSLDSLLKSCINYRSVDSVNLEKVICKITDLTSTHRINWIRKDNDTLQHSRNRNACTFSSTIDNLGIFTFGLFRDSQQSYDYYKVWISSSDADRGEPIICTQNHCFELVPFLNVLHSLVYKNCSDLHLPQNIQNAVDNFLSL